MQMSQDLEERHDYSSSSVSLATAIDRIARDCTLTRQRRHGICSGLRSYARIVRLSPEAIHVSADVIRPTLRALTPARTGLSAGRVAGIKCNLGFVLRYLSVGEGCRPHGGAISVEFAALLSMTDDRWHKMVLRRFFAYCTDIGISPSDVTSDVIDRFLSHLTHSTLASNPSLCARCVRRVWNKCSGQYPLWPKQILEAAVRRNPVLALQGSVQSDIERYAAFVSGAAAHPVSGAHLVAPLRPSSLRVHVGMIRRCASMVAAAGINLGSLRDLVTPEAISALKSTLYGHEPSYSASYIRDHLSALQLVATRWGTTSIETRLSPALAAARAHATSPRKFRQIIELMETGSFAKLLDLPGKVMAEALQLEDGDRRRIARGQVALALEIMMMVPVWPGQLTVTRTRDILEIPSEPPIDGQLTIVVQSLFKRRVSLRYTLPKRTVQLYRLYRDRVFQASDGGEWLFPGPAGGRRHAGSFGETIRHKIAKDIGVEMTCTALRFLGGTVYLLRHPSGYEVVRRAMGYGSVAEARRMFSFVRIVNSFNKFDSLVTASATIGGEAHRPEL